MDILDFMAANWQVLASAPLALLGAVAVGGFIGYWLARAHYQGEAKASRILADAARERLAAAQEETNRLEAHAAEAQQQVGYLMGRLSAHSEDIEFLKEEMRALPRVIVSDRPPGPGDEAPHGTLWVTTDDPPQGRES